MLVAFEAVRRVFPDSSKPAADPHGPVISVVIPRGVNASSIGGILEQRGVVADGSRFRNYAKEQGQGADFKAGSYGFRAGTDYDAIIKRLDLGPPGPRLATLVLASTKRPMAVPWRRPARRPASATTPTWRASCSPPPIL